MNYWKQPKQKYGNQKSVYNGIEFDSKKEMMRYAELELLQRAGEISNLQRQVKFVLIPAQYETVFKQTPKLHKIKEKQKLIEKECAYIADFVYLDKKGNQVVEDVKSPITRTKEYIIKRKLMLHIYHIKIAEV